MKGIFEIKYDCFIIKHECLFFLNIATLNDLMLIFTNNLKLKLNEKNYKIENILIIKNRFLGSRLQIFDHYSIFFNCLKIKWFVRQYKVIDS